MTDASRANSASADQLLATQDQTRSLGVDLLAHVRPIQQVRGHSECQSDNEKPITLGKSFGAINGTFVLAAVVWALFLKFSGHHAWDYALSVAASGLATASVLLLAVVAAINWFACWFHWRYLWALPGDIRLPLDYAIPAAVVLGIVGGWLVWQ